MSSPAQRVPTYDSLGVRPLVNCRGTLTIIGGSLMLPEVVEAMGEASRRFVNLEELMEAVGARLAELLQVEWGLVTSGCAAALCQITAACVAGRDPDKIDRLPDTTGMKDQVVVPAGQRHGYDLAIRMVGVEIVEVESREELAAAVGDRTAMFALKGNICDHGPISIADLVRVGRPLGIPILVDAAAERPEIPNRYLEAGADAVAYSGGKCIRGPQSSGLVVGRRELLETAFLNGCPHHSLGRPMKAGKEEIMGLLTAVEQWVRRDHTAEWRDWKDWLGHIADSVSRFPSVTTDIADPTTRADMSPCLAIEWDPDELNIRPAELTAQLAGGEPRIEVAGSERGIAIMAYTLEPGEDQVIANRICQILATASGRTEVLA